VYDSLAACQIVDPGLKRMISHRKERVRVDLVWNPGAERAAQMAPILGANAWPGLLCVESANVGSQKSRCQRALRTSCALQSR